MRKLGWRVRGGKVMRVRRVRSAPVAEAGSEDGRAAAAQVPDGAWQTLWRVEAAPAAIGGRRATLYRVVDDEGRIFGFHLGSPRLLGRLFRSRRRDGRA